MTEQKEYISQVNSHVEDYLDYYCGLSHSPGFAVLLKGEWGCGKTWFIKKYCEKLEKNKREEVSEGKLSHRNILSKVKKITSVIPRKKSQRENSDEVKDKAHLYISLNGVASLNDIGAKLVLQLLPSWFSSKEMAVIGNFTTELIKSQSRFDSGSLIKSIVNSVNKNSQAVLIFDDLERCKVDISELFGYINEYIEHQQRKVIILANEDKLFETDNYKDIKEKLIGKTFEIGFDLHGALEDFIEKVENSEIRNIFKENTQLIEGIYQTAEYRNLRSLKQIILDFERIFRGLPDKAKDKPELLREILKILTAFSIEIKRGNLLPKDICQLQEAEKHRKEQPRSEYISKVGGTNPSQLSDKERKKFTHFQEVTDKYDFIKDLVYEFQKPILNLLWWQNFFDKGIIHENFQELIFNSRYFIDDYRHNWEKLYNFYYLNDDELEDLLKKVESEFSNRRFIDLGEIKKVTDIFLKLSEKNLYYKSPQQILQNARDYIDYLIKENKLDLNPESDAFWFVKYLAPYKGTGFQEKALKEFYDYLKTARQSAIEKNIPSMSLELLDIMQTDLEQFMRMICPNNSSSKGKTLDQRYIRVPILKYINPGDFVDIILSMSFDNQATCFYGLQIRYEFEEYSKNLVEELDWLKSVQNLLMQEANSRKGKPSGLRLKDLNENYLSEAIASLGKQKLDGEQRGSNDK